MRGLVSVGFDYLRFDGFLRQNDSPSAYSSDNYMMSAKWSGRPVDWLNFTYELNWDKDKMVLKNLGFDSSSTNLAQNLTFNFQPLKSRFIKLQWRALSQSDIRSSAQESYSCRCIHQLWL